ncbi:MAG: hypothetical protein EOP05_19120 [Proteobacteria bacterium]|nr:MAG: hypothetical protein EOP05_19120 [Pseudomonadota bacterium]
MKSPNHAVASALVAATLLTTLVACGPARWAEHGAGNNGASGSPDTAVKPAVFESFLQDDAANKVDILIVNDNSASMDEEQTKMSTRFANFVSALKGIDYRIAMTTTDIDSKRWGQHGKIMPWGTGGKDLVLTPATLDASTKFKQTIQRTETIGCIDVNDGYYCPSSTEQPLKAIELAIDERTGANSALFRDNVDFVAVVLSDEDEKSTGPSGATKAEDVVAHFQKAFNGTKRMNVHGIVVKPGDSVCLKKQASQGKGAKSSYATRVSALAGLTNGSLNSICDSDYSKSLSSISSQVQKLVSSFDLEQAPKAGTVKVKLVPAPSEALNWSVEGNHLIFSTPPAAGTRIEVSYEI